VDGRREPDGLTVLREVTKCDRLGVVDQQAEDLFSLRQLAHVRFSGAAVLCAA
jgi:hypothetical protein